MNKIAVLQNQMISMYAGDPKRIQHFMKVYSFARLIGEMELLPPDQQEILEAAALVHDIGIKAAEEKYGDCSGPNQEKEGPALARKMLSDLQFDQPMIDRVCFLVGHHHTYTNIVGLEYQILVEADLLVNFFEEHLSQEAIKASYLKMFKTPTGKSLCVKMYA